MNLTPDNTDYINFCKYIKPHYTNNKEQFLECDKIHDLCTNNIIEKKYKFKECFCGDYDCFILEQYHCDICYNIICDGCKYEIEDSEINK